jgi:galactokinase
LTASAWPAADSGAEIARRDAEAFRAYLARTDLFARDREVFVARAPGRLDVIGGIADYSGSLVLEWPLADATFVAVQPDRRRPLLLLASGARRARAYLPELLSFSYDDARAYFAADPSTRWASYVAGAFLVLARELGVHFSGGAKILISSSVPEGKGVSSSAALEVAAMTATSSAYGLALEPRDLALLCQKVENSIAGAPCGVMDQMTAALGRSDRLLALLCQPAEVAGYLELPRGLALWGIDSGIRHAVSGADYGSVRAAAFMGRRTVEELTGSPVDYLANLTPTEFAALVERLPEQLPGRDFLARHDGTGDPMTRVDPGRVYLVRAASAHPVFEHARARQFAELLAPDDVDIQTARGLDARGERLGALMYESHASYSACGLGSDGTDALVELARRAGTDAGIYGAKITGGGRGGTVAILGREGAGPVVEAIAARYAQQSGRASRVFSGSSSGAAAWCGVHVRP